MSRNDTEHLLRSRANAARLRQSLHELREEMREVASGSRILQSVARSLRDLEEHNDRRIRPEPASPVGDRHTGSSFASFLDEEGIRGEVEEAARERVQEALNAHGDPTDTLED